MSKLVIALGIILAAGLAGCESLDKRGVSRETQGTVGGAVVGGVIGNEVGENQDEKRGRK